MELVGVGADRLHERQRPLDLAGHQLVALADRRLADEVGVPGVHLAQVGVAAGDEGADQVERGGRGVVDVDEPLRVGHPRLGGEVEAVDRVAAVGRQRDALAGLEVGGARLGVLPGEPADLDHRHRRGVGQHDRHLEQHAQLVADVVGGDAGEGLGAVAAHEHERLAARDRGDLVLQVVALTGEDQRRHRPEPGDGGVDAPRGRGRPAAGPGRGRAGPSRSGTVLLTRSRVRARRVRARNRSQPARRRSLLEVVDVAEAGLLGPDARGWSTQVSAQSTTPMTSSPPAIWYWISRVRSRPRAEQERAQASRRDRRACSPGERKPRSAAVAAQDQAGDVDDGEDASSSSDGDAGEGDHDVGLGLRRRRR